MIIYTKEITHDVICVKYVFPEKNEVKYKLINRYTGEDEFHTILGFKNQTETNTDPFPLAKFIEDKV